MKLWTLLLAGFALGTVVVADELDIWTKTINNDTNGVWYVQPDKPKPKNVKAEGIPGDVAIRVKASKGVNPWAKQATSPINGGTISEGDVIMVMAYLRAEQPAEGGSKLSLRVQLAGAPYTSAMDFTAPITSE